jgi:hypothetical protein
MIINKKITIVIIIAIAIFLIGITYYISLKKTIPEIPSQAIPKTEPKSSCVVLPEEYCPQGKLIYEAEQLIGLGFRVPEETPIFAPFKGELETNILHQINDRHYPGLSLKDTTREDYGRLETLTFFSPLGHFQTEIVNKYLEKGQILARVGPLTVNNQWGDYNLILNFQILNLKSGEWRNDINLLKQFFDYI